MKKSLPADLHILHFNDVYELEGRASSDSDKQKVLGGAARFFTEWKRHGFESKLNLFSGDLFGPSTISAMFKGQNMVDFINLLGVRVACLGNHETEYGLGQMEKLIRDTKVPWLLANLYMADGSFLPGCQPSCVVEHLGAKIGLIGLCEKEWLGLFSPLKVQEDFTYRDYSDVCREIATELKAQGCDYIIALTHMKTSNDRLLAQNTQGFIDLILGGHDHCSVEEQIGSVSLIKSGTDFEEFSDVHVDRLTLKATRKLVRITAEFDEDPEVKALVGKYANEVAARLDQVCAVLREDLEGRFECTRAMETNIGNWICDVILTEYEHADVVIMNAGTIRSNQVFSKGPLTFKQMAKIIPMDDKIIEFDMPGHVIIKALENGVSVAPAVAGKFLQLSGLNLKYDSKKPPG
jgi:5'-nucleotidase